MSRSRTSARRRLVANFLGSLPDQLASLAALAAEVDDEDHWDSVSSTVERLGQTAASLELGGIASAAAAAAELLGVTTVEAAFAPLIRAIRESSPIGPFAPIAIVGDDKQVQSIAQQDDGTCEPLQLYNNVDELRRLVVEWPQAIAIPASEAQEVRQLMQSFGCSVYVYGPARDEAGRAHAAREGATGFVAEPVVLPELLSALRYRNSLPKRGVEVALLGPKEWSAPLMHPLLKRGAHPTAFTDPSRVGAVLHGLFPDVVVLGPGSSASIEIVVRMIRGHVGRSHVSILAVGASTDVRGLGVDGVVDPAADLYEAIEERWKRMLDHQSDRDVLTQLPNRAGILRSVQRALAWSERHGDTVSLGLVQAHRLEQAAREHGMEAANAGRRHLAVSLQRGMRRLDEVGYLGEDLFCTILYNTRSDQVGPRLEQLCRSFLTRAHADRRLREIRLSTAIADTSAGVRGLLLRTVRQLSALQ